ncbi:MAG: hypothetical protein EOO85_26420 [Pedobacter sp.]|nr:MAG: hypothetical protein EOO85_26420 [Pedobacter sp.]
MNVKEYISSGIVESYVLGLADEAERAEFESMCASYPEVRDARDAFELSLEQQVLEGAGAPPASVKDKLFAELAIAPVASSFNVPPVASNVPPVFEKSQQAVVVKSSGFLKYLAAASVILLIGSTALNFYFYIFCQCLISFTINARTLVLQLANRTSDEKF